MKILIAARSLPHHQIGGMEAVTWDLARAFVELGAQVTVLTTTIPGRPAGFVEDGVTVRTIASPPGRYSSHWWRGSRALYRAELRQTMDVVLSVSAGARAMAGERAARGTRPVFFLQAHGTAWGEIKSKLRLRRPVPWLKALATLPSLWADRAYRGFDAAIAVGNRVADDLLVAPTAGIIGNLPVSVIENGVDERCFAFSAADRARVRARLGFDDTDRVIISASRLHPQKGVAEGLAGFAHAAAADPTLRMLIVGEGPSGPALRDRARTLGVQGRVVFVGALARPEMPAYLSAADVFLFPTRRIEGLPMNLLEALANGLSLVISPEVDAGWPRSYVAPATDPTLLGARLAEALGQRADRSLLPERHTLRHSAAAYLRLFATHASGNEGR